MKMYDYAIVNKKDNKILDKAFVREDARYLKNEWKENGFDVKILQRVYKLAEEREIR